MKIGMTTNNRVANDAALSLSFLDLGFPSGARMSRIVQLVATGGSDTGFTWALVDAGSGGSIDAATGVYTACAAPTAGASDVVEVTDSLGNTARVSIRPAAALKVTASGGRGCGCGCDTAGPGTPSFALLGLAAAFVLARRRRRVTN